jgi:hypothetical protein
MRGLEGWAFMSLMGCTLLIALSASLLTGGWAIAGYGVAALLGVLSGGLYGASAQQRR